MSEHGDRLKLGEATYEDVKWNEVAWTSFCSNGNESSVIRVQKEKEKEIRKERSGERKKKCNKSLSCPCAKYYAMKMYGGLDI
jgi:hypothetical protein